MTPLTDQPEADDLATAAPKISRTTKVSLGLVMVLIASSWVAALQWSAVLTEQRLAREAQLEARAAQTRMAVALEEMGRKITNTLDEHTRQLHALDLRTTRMEERQAAYERWPR